ncbi:MAG: type II secretion system F family protein [Anaerolineae bacterium]
MTPSSKSSPKRGDKNLFKRISPFELFYQLTYLSAMSSAGVSRSKLFELAAEVESPTAVYFAAINTLVVEFRYDYAEACRAIGVQSKSENLRSFLLRWSDALRSGEPMADFLTREAEVQALDYQNKYERDLESLKQWTNAFSSIVISVALIIIIQVITSMVYSSDLKVMSGMAVAGLMMNGLGAWIILRSAPREVLIVPTSRGSAGQLRTLRFFRLLTPLSGMAVMLLWLIGIPMGWLMIAFAVVVLPIGILSGRSDKEVTKKDEEFSTFLRSIGGMASASGTTLKQAITKLELDSFPMLAGDIQRLSTRLQALVEPEICWRKFGMESGSRLISDVIAIFYHGVRIGGDPERVGYLCSLFTSRTVQLRAKRRLIAGTFTGMTTVMHTVVAVLMVFVLSIVQNFAAKVATLLPTSTDAMANAPRMSLGIAEFSPGDLQFLSTITVMMVLMMALVASGAIIAANGGFRLKIMMYLALTVFISGISFLIVPPLVASILKV